jgi:hypothetical protein
MSKKGQAALEFMMTYGWAILVVLAAIGALSYFGVLNPTRLTPDTCLTTSGFGCLGKPVLTDESVAFSVSNGLGYTIALDPNMIAGTGTFAPGATYCDFTAGATISICDTGETSGASCETSGGTDTYSVPYSGSATIFIDGCDFEDINVLKGDITLQYMNPQSMLNEQVTISLTGKVPK